MKTPETARFSKTSGYLFRKKKLFVAALTHPSCPSHKENNGIDADFQRLEFLGDAVLNYFIVQKLYEHFPKADEGFLSRLRSVLVSRRLLARIAKTIRLKSFLALPFPFTKQPGRVQEKILADSLESLMGAMFLDRGYSKTEAFLEKHFRPYFSEKKLLRVDPNPKSALQEYVQKKWHVLPAYACESKEKDWFVAWVSVQGKMKTKGEGETKQEAETEAAAKLLKRLIKKC